MIKYFKKYFWMLTITIIWELFMYYYVIREVLFEIICSKIPTKPPDPPFFGCPYIEMPSKVAVITGGTQGIGLAVAKDLIRKGVSRVIVAGRDLQTGAKAIKILNAMCSGVDQKAVYVPTDVTSRDQLKSIHIMNILTPCILAFYHSQFNFTRSFFFIFFF